MDFIKMQTLGNDYILMDCLNFNKNDYMVLKDKIKIFSDRHFGIRASGVVFMMDSKVADVKLLTFNSDGTESKICSDSIRCSIKYLYDNKLTSKNYLKVETKSGIKDVSLRVCEDGIESIMIDMGKPDISARKIPVITDKSIFVNEDICVLDKKFKTTCISVGNPHAVCFVNNVDFIDLQNVGPYFETNYHFPERVNIEFVQVIDDKTIKIRIWSRGVGEVLSCGSGACASVVAGVLNHYLNRDEDIFVLSKGGGQKVNYSTNGNVILKGNAKFVFEGKKYQIGK